VSPHPRRLAPGGADLGTTGAQPPAASCFQQVAAVLAAWAVERNWRRVDANALTPQTLPQALAAEIITWLDMSSATNEGRVP